MTAYVALSILGGLVSAIVVTPPQAPAIPLVVTVPHAGRRLVDDMERGLRVPVDGLRQLEDPWMDRLLAAAPAHGAWLLRTRWARAVVDVNRAPDEFAFTSAVPGWRATGKARIGLGVVPTRLAGAPIYRQPLTPMAVEERLALAHRPYHEALAGLLATVKARFGAAFLLDGHSMPESALPATQPPIDAVVGDRWGAAADPAWRDSVEQALAGAGLVAVRNRPYAGGFITRAYGRPQAGVHAVQVELRRSLYMDEATHEAGAGFDALARRLDGMLAALATYLRARSPDAFAVAGE